MFKDMLLNSEPLSQYKIVVAVNNDKILAENLARSTAYSKLEVQILRGCQSASIAFNEVLDSTRCRYFIFVHQDVYLPESWLTRMDDLIDKIQSSIGENWAVIGVAGVSPSGRVIGKLWSEGTREEIDDGEEIEEAVSLDEVLLVVNAQSGVRFDAHLPGFHLYGTDIVQTSLKMGKKCFVAKNPIVHNDRTKYFLDSGFGEAFKFMSAKWRNVLPIPTTVTTLEKTCWPITWRNFRQLRRYFSRGDSRKIDSRLIAVQLGYE
jgi:hypothetical protein